MDAIVPGLAAAYPGDRGIESDPSVLLAESFETGDVQDLNRRWSHVNNPNDEVLAIVDQSPPGGTGRRCLEMTGTLGRNSGGGLFGRLARPVDTLFARFYARFPADGEYIHHGIQIGGANPPTNGPDPHAGECPHGDDRISIGIEPRGLCGRLPAPGTWGAYVYWHEMVGEADGHHWGNIFYPESATPIPLERWQCVEMMIKLNSTVQSRDGELAIWIDGEQVMRANAGARTTSDLTGDAIGPAGGKVFSGFNWRTSLDLQLNYFWLNHYISPGAALQNKRDHPNPVHRVFYDNIVVSTSYIGPIVPLPTVMGR